MTSTSVWLGWLPAAAFAVVALVAARDVGRLPAATIRWGRRAGRFGVVVALAAAVAVAVNGTMQSPTLGVDGLGVSVRLDALSVGLLLMITLLALVIFDFSCRYLDGDDRHATFLARVAATIAAVEVLVLAGNVVVLVVAWVVTSLVLHRLLVFYPERRRAAGAARKKFLVARLADALLIAAVVLLYSWAGTGDLGAIFDRAASGPVTPALAGAAVLLAVAAILKSAQFPTHGWLVEVMETPTPVSALLHAGILNAGPFLVMRMSGVIDDVAGATALLVVVGGFTALFASVVLLTQPAVKVALGYSSAAHMGFSLLLCGAGLYSAAFLHLVAHSFYKAHAFLSSGSAIDEARARGVPLPTRLGSPWRLAASFAVALGVYGTVVWLWRLPVVDEPMLLALGAIIVLALTQLVAPTLDSDGPVAAVLGSIAMAAGVSVAFVVLESVAHDWLHDAIADPAARTVVHGVLLTVVLAAFTAVVAVQLVAPTLPAHAWRQRLAVHVRNGLYANALFDRLVGAHRLDRHRPVGDPALVLRPVRSTQAAR